jgi:hypothetical protein
MRIPICSMMLCFRLNMLANILRVLKVVLPDKLNNSLIINMDQTGIVLLENSLIPLLATKAKITCFGMKDKQLFYYIKWGDLNSIYKFNFKFKSIIK